MVTRKDVYNISSFINIAKSKLKLLTGNLSILIYFNNGDPTDTKYNPKQGVNAKLLYSKFH